MDNTAVKELASYYNVENPKVTQLLLAVLNAQEQGQYGIRLDGESKLHISSLSQDFLISDGGRVTPFVLKNDILMTRRIFLAVSDIWSFFDTISPRFFTDYKCIFTKGLSDEQKMAVINSMSTRVSIITGGPGTGKTTVIARLIKEFQNCYGENFRCTVCAPTGKAAMRLGAVFQQQDIDVIPSTIHRILGFSPSRGTFRAGPQSPLETDLIVVDECSMLDIFLARQLINSVNDNVSMVFIGDAQQLPPVGTGRFFGDMVDFFTKKSERVCVSVLSENFRAGAQGIKKLIENVRDGALKPSVFDDFEDVSHIEDVSVTRKMILKEGKIDSGWDCIEAHEVENGLIKDNKYIKSFNKLMSSIILTTMNKGLSGTENINALIRDNLEKLNYGGFEDFIPGERLIVTRNNYRWNIFNGDMGVCANLKDSEDESLYLLVMDRDGLRLIPLNEISGYVNRGWAISVHRSQGSEFNSVHLIIPDSRQMQSRELLYTGISRAKKLLTISSGKEILEKMVVTKKSPTVSLADLRPLHE
ncbi:MAG: AAA family ATPase [Deltaproteobacteria bacterium]|nr:AAA family ATPase [Deltaproteobacteria bacterium]